MLIIGDIMKNKTFFILMINIIIFITIYLFLEFNYVESIDTYSHNIHNILPLSFKNIFLFITNTMSIIGITTILILASYLLRNKNAKNEIILYIITILSCLTITNLIKIRIITPTGFLPK